MVSNSKLSAPLGINSSLATELDPPAPNPSTVEMPSLEIVSNVLASNDSGSNEVGSKEVDLIFGVFDFLRESRAD